MCSKDFSHDEGAVWPTDLRVSRDYGSTTHEKALMIASSPYRDDDFDDFEDDPYSGYNGMNTMDVSNRPLQNFLVRVCGYTVAVLLVVRLACVSYSHTHERQRSLLTARNVFVARDLKYTRRLMTAGGRDCEPDSDVRGCQDSEQ
eukprot:8316646-Pyramimonas_sp.AAC.1